MSIMDSTNKYNTLLEEDLSGINKENWQRLAHCFVNTVDTLIKQGYIYFDNNGVALWKTSNKVLPLGYLDALVVLKVNFNYEQSLSLRRHAEISLKPYLSKKFYNNIKGKDKFWVRDTFKTVVERQTDYMSGKLFVDRFGVVRWSTNNRVIPKECFDQLAYSGVLPRNYFEKNDKFREKELWN